MSFVVLAADAELIKEPLTTPISVNLVSTLPDLDSKLFNLPSCASFVVLAADAELIKLPDTTPISVNLVSADWVNRFWFVFATAAADAELIKLPLTTPISVNLSFAEPVNVFKALVDVFELVNEFNAATEIFTLAELEFRLVIETSCESFVVFAADAELINEPVIVDNAVSYVLNPVVDCSVIWDEPETTESPSALNSLLSAPAAPAFQ